MSKLSILALALIAVAPVALGSGIEYSVGNTQPAQHQVMVEGPNIVNLDTEAALVAALNKKVDAQLQRAVEDVNNKVDKQIELLYP